MLSDLFGYENIHNATPTGYLFNVLSHYSKCSVPVVSCIGSLEHLLNNIYGISIRQMSSDKMMYFGGLNLL